MLCEHKNRGTARLCPLPITILHSNGWQMKVSVDGKMVSVKINRKFEPTDLAFANDIVMISGGQGQMQRMTDNITTCADSLELKRQVRRNKSRENQGR